MAGVTSISGLFALILLILQCQTQQAAGYIPARGPVASVSLARPQPIEPSAEAPGPGVDSNLGYTAEALKDKIPELPAWGKLDFGLYSGYASR